MEASPVSQPSQVGSLKNVVEEDNMIGRLKIEQPNHTRCRALNQNGFQDLLLAM
jgi:hypothetical protein